MIWVHTIWHRGFFNISADEKKQTTFVAIGALRVNDKGKENPINFILFTKTYKLSAKKAVPEKQAKQLVALQIPLNTNKATSTSTSTSYADAVTLDSYATVVVLVKERTFFSYMY